MDGGARGRRGGVEWEVWEIVEAEMWCTCCTWFGKQMRGVLGRIVVVRGVGDEEC